MTTEMKATEIVTAPMRLSFPALFEPKPTSKKPGSPLKYQASVLLPPGTDMKPFAACVKAAMIDEWNQVIKLPARNNPIKDCGEKDLEGYDEGWYYINSKSGYQPGVIDQRKQEVLDADRIFAGCWCRFHLTAYAWDHPEGGKGVSFSLNAVQLVKEDARLDGRRPATDMFDAVEVEGDDAVFDGATEAEDPMGGIFG